MVTEIRSSTMVKPAKPTPNVGTFVSDLDQEKPTTHAPTVYFYHPSKTFSFSSVFETLKNSLSQVLVHFSPVAGRLHYTHGGRVRLECNAAGVMFYEAESTERIEDFKDFAPTHELRPLLPSVDYSVTSPELPLMFVQLTKLGCGGIALALAISHIMMDGASASHFVTEWARIARGEPLGNLPFLDRSVCMALDPPSPPRFKHDRFEPTPILIGHSDAQEERTKETKVTMLRFSKTQVQKIKDMANEGRASGVQPYSRYEALAGHMWRCASKAREHHPEQPTILCIAVGFRGRMGIPREYFGNAVLRQMAKSRSGELTSRPLSYASSTIREAVKMVTDDYVKSFIDLVKSQPDLSAFRTFHTVGPNLGAFYGNPNMEITSWLGIPLQGTDFGWGKEIYMGPGSLNFDGKSFIFPAHGEDGSLSIALRLQVCHMDKFINFLCKDIVE